MENKVKILKEMGYDITGIIEGCDNPSLIIGYIKINSSYKSSKWTEEEITEFSNKIYDIVTKQEKTNGQKENF